MQGNILRFMKKNIHLFSIVFIALFFHTKLEAQRDHSANLNEDLDIPETMIWPIDSLLNDWKTQQYISFTKEDCTTAKKNPHFDDDTYIERLARIPSILEFPYNSTVRRYIDVYAERLRNQVAVMLAASNFYMPIFEEALDAYGVPNELKYLPIVESALNPSATSRVGAAGLWQFMLSTGKQYGLESNSLVDERRDPIKSSWAAARFFSDLYKIYNDWNLVIAAYNCGPGNVNKAIRRSGGSKDYWEIYYHLPRETRGYIPAFVAVNYIMNYYCEHDICPVDGTLPVVSDTIKVTKDIHFEQISKFCNTSIEEIRSLNPQYKHDIIPGNTKPYTLRLPYKSIPNYITYQDSIYNYNRDNLFSKRKMVAIKNATYPTKGTIYYRIKRGDTLSEIASKYRVSVNSLRRWNNIRGNNIVAGKTLKIIK